MTASDYPVTFGYGAQDGVYYGPNGSVGAFHRGNDRACPTGTPIVIGGKTVGLTGVTGATSGPHLHTQAGTDKACQLTIDPTPLDFKPGVVVATQSVDAGQWGKYVTVRVGTKYITYAHLSKVNVIAGEVLNMTTNRTEAIWLYRVGFRLWSPTDAQKLKWTNRDLAPLLEGIYNDPTFKSQSAKISAYDGLVKQVAELSARPTKAELQAVTDQLGAEHAKVLELEASKSEDSKLLDDSRGLIARIVARLFNR